jgi:hypothetical protein
MSEKLLPCPFCGGPARTFDFNGTAQATCAGDFKDCAGADGYSPVAMWNRRTPAPEREAWRTVPVEPTEAMPKAWDDYRHNASGVVAWKAMIAALPPAPTDTGRE